MPGGITGILRGQQRGKNPLGGLTRVYCFELDQFLKDGVEYPNRVDYIANGKVTATLPLVSPSNEKSARLVFDIATAKFASGGKVSITQFSHRHGLTGKIAGYTAEQAATIEEMSGKHFLLVAERPNGDYLLLGTTWKPMMFEVSADGGENGDAYVGRDIKFDQTDVCDFQPPIFSSSVALSFNTNNKVATPVYS
jgi:hypothetical protein